MMNLPRNWPPCSRYEGGENNPRVSEVMADVLANTVEALLAKIERAHDHKGILYVVYRRPLTTQEQALFRRAWGGVALENRDDVEFVDVYSQEWRSVWDFRRFDEFPVKRE